MLSTSNNITETQGTGMATVYKAGARKRAPTHPGAVIASALKGLGVTSNAAAKAMGLTAPTLANVINADSAVTPNMALRLGRYLGNGPEIWLGLQADYDLWHTREKLKSELAKIEPAAVE